MPELMEALHISDSPYVNAAVALAAFITLAKIADTIIVSVVKRLAAGTETDLDDRIIEILHRPIFVTVALVGVILSVEYLEPSERIAFALGGALFTVMIVVWAHALLLLASVIIEHAVTKVTDVTGLGRDMVPFLKAIAKIVIVASGLMAGFSVWEVSITPLLASAGIVGAGVAFAAKDTVSNLLGGISVFVDKPFKIGDYIIISSGERGEVVSIGLRSTRIQTRDYTQIIVPNSIIASSKVINESAPEPNFRVRIPISVAYGTDMGLLEKTLIEIASRNGNVVAEPEPRIRFRQFGDSGLNVELLCWAKEPALRGLTIHEINTDIYNTFNRIGIVFPFPQRDVRIRRDA
jgi:small-conductance mechanosensitive channel